MSIIATQSRLARPSMIRARRMTAAERIAFATGEMDLCLDPRELATEHAGLVLRDRIGMRPVGFTRAAFGEIGGNPALQLDGTTNSGSIGTGAYRVPPSYFIATLVAVDTLADTAAFVASATPTDNRLFFGALQTGSLRLDHGPDAALMTPGGKVTAGRACIAWASYSAETGAAALGIDAVSPTTTGTLAAKQKGDAQTLFWGGLTTWPVDGRGGLLVVADRYLGGAEGTDVRAAILGWLAEYGGVTLGA